VVPVRVDAKARVCVRQSFYSVPARYAGRRLTARIGADGSLHIDGQDRVARLGAEQGPATTAAWSAWTTPVATYAVSPTCCHSHRCGRR